MVALRLAEHVAHTTDVNAMLDGMSPYQLDEWIAKDFIEPIGHVTQMTAFIAYAIAAYVGGKDAEANPVDFMPWLRFASGDTTDNAAARAFLSSTLKR